MNNINIQNKLQSQRKFFDEYKTYDINQRIVWLKTLKQSLINHEQELLVALKQDLGRDETVGYMSEVKLVYHELNNFIKHIKKWSKDTYVKPILLMFHKKARIAHIPHGQIYEIVPFNFPILLSLQPLTAAIACGNVVTLKMSNLTIHVNEVIQKIVSVLPNDLVYYLDEKLENIDYEDLNQYPWDFIFFTGGIDTAKKIYSQQYFRFIPTVFELGGKSPMIIDDTINLKFAATKYLTTKLINSGQICVAADYLIIKKDVVQEFTKILKEVYETNFKNKRFYNGNLISKTKVDEVNSWLNKQNKNDFIIYDMHNVKGYDELKFCFIDYKNVCDKQYLDHELFCPIGYYYTYSETSDILDIIKLHPFPLAFYCFSKNKTLINFLKYHTQSGAFIVNDTLVHVFQSNLPFGGIKSSGLGQYHGKKSFLTFSINKPCLESKWYGDKLIDENRLFDKNYWLTKIIRKHK